MTRIHDRLQRDGRLTLGKLFTPGMHKSTHVGIFLAMLELVRHHHVRAEQNDLFGEIWVLPGPRFDAPLDLAGSGRLRSHSRGTMIHNLPVKTLRHNDLTIEGYSRAAVQTYWRIPELKLGFDLGAQPWSFMGTGTWFVSHAHLDHIAALPLYVARRRMMKMEPPTIYLPESTVDPVQQILRQFTRLDRGRMPCKLVAVQPGDEIELSRETVVTVAATDTAFPRWATSSGSGGASSSQNLPA